MDDGSGRLVGPYSTETRLIAALCYLVLLIVPILVLMTDLRGQRFLRYHGYQGVAVGILLLAFYFVAIPFAVWLSWQIPCLGWVFACTAPFLYLVGFGLQLFWTFLAYQGEAFSIPVLGNLAASSFRD